MAKYAAPEDTGGKKGDKKKEAPKKKDDKGVGSLVGPVGSGIIPKISKEDAAGTSDDIAKREYNQIGISDSYIFTNPDGTPHYAINTSVKLSITPKDKKFSVAKNSIKGKQSTPPNQMFG